MRAVRRFEKASPRLLREWVELGTQEVKMIESVVNSAGFAGLAHLGGKLARRARPVFG